MLNFTCTDRFFEWATSANLTDATLQFQKYIVEYNYTGFGGGNPDLGGIGVVTSLSILCLACTFGSCVVMFLGLLFHTKSYNRRTPFLFLVRINDAFTAALSTFLDSALFFSLTVQLAGFIWLCKSLSLPSNAVDMGGAQETGGQIYNILLLLYTSIITICPAVTLINTSYFRRNIRRRGFRLITMILILAFAGALNFFFTKEYKQMIAVAGFDPVDKEPSDEYKANNGCVPIFLLEILPATTEAKVLRSCYFLCVAALVLTIILQWRDMTLRRSGRYLHRFLHILNNMVYIGNQFLPLYLLWRIRWIRLHVRTIIKAPETGAVMFQGVEGYKDAFKQEERSWDNDDWNFGQLLALSLWFPALLELVYILIVGPTRGLTNRLPFPWTAERKAEVPVKVYEDKGTGMDEENQFFNVMLVDQLGGYNWQAQGFVIDRGYDA